MAEAPWLEWSEEVFKKAQEEDKPVLLLLVVPWCRYCRDMQERVFRDENVLRNIRRGWIPVRVNAEKRPDIDGRYNMGGWPTVAFLTPKGELITGTIFVEPEELVSLLERVEDFYKKNKEKIEENIQEKWAEKEKREKAALRKEEGALSPSIVQTVTDSILEAFDPEYGGWGKGQKFPHPESIDFLLVQYVKTGDPRMREVVEKTLDQMMKGGIYDPVDGGFFRYSTTRDWKVPHLEKVLDSNAARLVFYMDAAQVLGREDYLDVARGIVDWMMNFMYDPETGAFFGSMDADPDYYARDAEGRRELGPPKIDRTIYTNWNAMAVVGLYLASVVLEKPELREAADRTMEFLLDRLYIKGKGMFHYWDGTYHLPGILSDQAYMVRALVFASQFNGNADLLLPAEDIVETLLDRQKAEGGGFYDIPRNPHSIGGLRRRNRSILENSVLAEAMVRLAYLSRRFEFLDAARETLEAFVKVYKEYGYYVAGYARAVDLFFYEPLFVTVVGDRNHPRAEALRHAALKTYEPSVLVQSLDPAHDPILMGRSGYTPRETPVAYLCVGKTSKAAVEDPDRLPAEMERIERERRAREQRT